MLGIDAFVRVAKIREIEQRRRGRAVDAAEPVDEDGLLVGETDEELPGCDNKTSSASRKKSKKKAANREPGPDNITSQAAPVG